MAPSIPSRPAAHTCGGSVPRERRGHWDPGEVKMLSRGRPRYLGSSRFWLLLPGESLAPGRFRGFPAALQIG